MINLTLIGQMIAFAIFVWFTMKFVWPPLIGAVNERQQKIEEGLDAAKKARADLATAEAKIEEQFAAAKSEAAVIIERANKAANQMIEEAKAQASIEGERLIMQAHAVIESERKKTQEDLRRELAELVIVGAEKILQDSIDRQRHKQMIDDLAASLGSR